jgi:hypothetical protein
MATVGALVAAAPAYASFTQEAGSPYPVGTAPFGVVSADFDASGHPDVAAINGTSSNLSVLLRQAGGGFAAEANSPFATGGGPNFGAVADFNADGRPDVAVAAFTGASATIMLRQPGGGFAAEAGSPSPGGRASAVAAADFNGDGLPDVAVANWDGGSVSVFLRQPGGFAQEGGGILVGPNPRYLVASDFNGDGLPDLAVSNQGSGTVTVLLRRAGGFAAEGAAIPVGSTPAGMIASDFNGDGRADLAVANFGTSTVSVLLRQPSGGFAEEAGSPIPVATGAIGLAGADFNGDGRQDMAVTSNTAGAVTVLLRQAAGGFAADAGSPIPIPSAYAAAAADFDGDGRPDLAVSADGPGTVTVLLNTTLPPPPAPPAAPVPGRSAVGRVVSGQVLVKLPGKRFVALTAAANIPMGSQLDTRKGRVALTSAADTAGKKTQSADFYDGIFQIKQTVPTKKPKKPAALITDLVMKGQVARSQCAPLKGARSAVAAKKKKGPKGVLGQLWGNGKGKFRTNGKYSSATVRGTIWLVQDRCEGTLTKVRRGTVQVRDFKRKKTVNVKAGHSYLARAQRAASKAKPRQ